MPSEIEFQLISPAQRTSSRPDEGDRAGRGRAVRVRPAAGSFARDLGNALGIGRSAAGRSADRQADAIAHGAGNLHEVALAFEKADVAMRLAGRVRNKLVDAYNEIMRMSV